MKVRLAPSPALLALCAGCGWVAHDNGDDLLTAAAKGDVAAASRLIAHGVDVNYRDKVKDGFTPLLWACFEDQSNMVTFLPDRGADPNICGSFGQSSVGLALGHVQSDPSNDGSTVRLLLKKGARKSFLQEFESLQDPAPEVTKILAEYLR